MIKTLIYLAPFVAIGGVLIQVIQNLGFWKNPIPISKYYKNCKYLNEVTPGPEDLAKLNSSTLVFSSSEIHYNELINEDTHPSKVGSIYAILNADTDKFQVKKLKMVSFPQHISFQPHGLYITEFIDGKYLYVINHAYQNGGERIECFKFIENSLELLLEYEFSIQMSPKLQGITNDLIVLNQGHLLITSFRPYPFPSTGPKGLDFLTKAKTLLMLFLSYKKTYTHSCKFVARKNQVIKPECKALDQTASVMTNGITWDKKDHIYIADTYSQVIKTYRYNPDDINVLEPEQQIFTDGAVDNLNYDPDTQKIYSASIYRIFDIFKILQFPKEMFLDRNIQAGIWSQVEEIDLNPHSPTYLKFQPIFRSENQIKSASSSYQIGNNLFIGSAFDQFLLVCQKPKSIDFDD